MNKRELLIVFILSIATFVVIALLMNINTRKQEANSLYFKVVELSDEIEDPKVWGENFPEHYEDYMKTVDQVRTRYGGSEAYPKTPTKADPRSVVSQSKIEEDHRLKVMWNGYAFAKDFREERGHAYMLIDQLYTGRQSVPQPGTCINCHASTVAPMKKLGNGDLEKGFHIVNKTPYKEVQHHFNHAVACIDCHEPKNMQLRVTRPAFKKGIAAFKKSQGVHDFDVDKDATRQEMRTFVCAQCHVEYYFKGSEKTLTYPWENGVKGDEILSYYQKEFITDWTHATTKTKMIKAQHPEFEMWSQGIHAKAGVSCVDCHMPYKKVGAQKITDHHVRSPVLMINRACQTCHKVSEDELISRVNTIQKRHIEIRDLALDALMDLIKSLEQYKNKDSKEFKSAQNYHREAQFLIDFVEAENSSGFHAPQEGARLLAKAIDLIRKGEQELVYK